MSLLKLADTVTTLNDILSARTGKPLPPFDFTSGTSLRRRLNRDGCGGDEAIHIALHPKEN